MLNKIVWGNCVTLPPLTIRYKEVIYQTQGIHIHNSISYEKKNFDNALLLVDLISYLTKKPQFIELNDNELNESLRELYENPIYTGADKLGVYFNQSSEDIGIPTLHNQTLFHLYSTALKQPEPLAKCVFLFRIVENSNLTSKLDCEFNKKQKPRLPRYLDYLISKALHYNLIPQFDFSKKGNKFKDETTVLKSKALRILKYWDKKGLNYGKEIYENGRCGVAHGAGKPNPLIFHDYSNHYKRISRINIILDLICKYLIERENKDLLKIVSSKSSSNVIY